MRKQPSKKPELKPSNGKSRMGTSASANALSFIDKRPKTALQLKLQKDADHSPLHTRTKVAQKMADNLAPIQKKANKTGIPDGLKAGIENLSGHSLDDVKVHYNSPKPAVVQAHAYAQGSQIHLAAGQEKHLPHEAWHVVQQKQGRVKPTLQMKSGMPVNDDKGLEREADVMGAKALQANSLQLKSKLPFGAFTSKPSNTVAQLNPKKTAKNIFSLGIRKLYVNHKRAKRAASVPAVVNDMPTKTPQEQFEEAYGKSRYYHSTHLDNHPSIEQHGLLNYTDRQKKLPEKLKDVIGYSRLGGEFEGDEKKGVFLGPKAFMKESNATLDNKDVVRAYLPANRTKTHGQHSEATTPNHELYRDPKFPGGAVIAKNSIPKETVTARNMEDLIGEHNSDPKNSKLGPILDAVGSHYPGGAPSHEEMKGHLQQAILERRLSNAAFDDSDY